MWRYGNDKPDIRFGMTLTNLKTPASVYPEQRGRTFPWNTATGFGVFDNAETVLAIAVPGLSEYTRKQLDELTDWVKRPQIGMLGLAYIKCNADGTYKSSFDKFFDEPKLKAVADRAQMPAGDLVLILAGPEERTRKAMSELRLEMGQRLGLRKPGEFKLLWVYDFPLFEYSEEDNRWVARHHPFTAPKPDHISVMIDNDPAIADPAAYLQSPLCRRKGQRL